MAGAPATIRIQGLNQLNRTLNKINRNVAREVREEFKKVAEPVSHTAEQMAYSNIRNLGTEWARMRVGTSGGTVYVAPATRGRRGSKRPNLGGLLMNEAMLPALEQHASEIEKAVADTFDRLVRSSGF